MRLEGNIRIYDMFDLVQISAAVWESPRPLEDRKEPLLRRAVMIAGRGEVEPSVWLRDALQALL